MNIRTLAAAALIAAGTLPAHAAPQQTKAYHMMVPGRRLPLPPTNPTMLYYAGPVIGTVKVVAVMWSGKVSAAIKSGVGPFLKAIANSTFIDQLAQYSTNIVGVNGMQGTDQTITRGSYLGKFVIKPVNQSKSLTDAQVQTELLGQISAGHVPPSDLNTLYMIYFPADISINLDGSLSCQGFGAYHFATSATVTPSNVFYAVMPDCGGGLAEQTVVSSHEFAEAISDAIPTPGSSPAYPQAWNTSDGYEIGDLCEGTSGTLSTKKRSWEIQEVFLNSTNNCGTGNFTSP
jgi:hypothetical protein